MSCIDHSIRSRRKSQWRMSRRPRRPHWPASSWTLAPTVATEEPADVLSEAEQAAWNDAIENHWFASPVASVPDAPVDHTAASLATIHRIQSENHVGLICSATAAFIATHRAGHPAQEEVHHG